LKVLGEYGVFGCRQKPKVKGGGQECTPHILHLTL
jgi:hypothetical protein